MFSTVNIKTPTFAEVAMLGHINTQDAALAAAGAKAASDVSATTTTQAELPPLPAKPASSKVFAAIDIPAGPIVSHKEKRKTRGAKKAAK
ncbi:hypothetical protein BC831DRAFT_512888 [Entophlyctis helioformis]|nr:hypothetical protein BC831DRAFT_512888 [Entophlyctis helioformis]